VRTLPIESVIEPVVVKLVNVGVADHAGAVLTPPETNTEPVATSAKRDNAVVLDAYNKSPIA